VAWATDQVLTEVERQRPSAIAAVTDWPDDIAGWRSVYRASRIGQERHELEAKFNTKVIADLDHGSARHAIEPSPDLHHAPPRQATFARQEAAQSGSHCVWLAPLDIVCMTYPAPRNGRTHPVGECLDPA
jgi:hypothetical protein